MGKFHKLNNKQAKNEWLSNKQVYHSPKYLGAGIEKVTRKRRAELLIKRNNKVEYLKREPFSYSNNMVKLLKYANPKRNPFRHLTFYVIEEVEKLFKG